MVPPQAAVCAAFFLLSLSLRDSRKTHMFDIDFAQSVQRIAVAFVPMMLGMVCHEVAHGWAAWRMGDPTARAQGRLTLNPLVHLDPMGSLMFVITALTSPFVLGWARPVPVDARWFRKPSRDMMLVSFAGPCTNFILAVMFAVLLKVLVHVLPHQMQQGIFFEFFLNMSAIGIWINFTLGWFNLIPVPPLDGSHILAGLLPPALARQYHQIGRYGIIVVLILLASGILGRVLWPLVDGSARVVTSMLGLAI